MRVEDFIKIIEADFYTGVPDSQLRPLCNYLMSEYSIDPMHHVIAANEGNCTALAAGYHLATGKVPVVYMQNSGEGNIVNPVASLIHENLYAIPIIFVIGWRGEPGIHDEPQHIYQGKITIKLLDDLGIEHFFIRHSTTVEEVTEAMNVFKKCLHLGKSVAFIVSNAGLSYDRGIKYGNDNNMIREDIIRHILAISEEDQIISTTGKTSRELFEIREANGQSHEYDFLTVGSMGHSSSIALGVAINKPEKKIWCIDGDGAVLMHMGAMAVIGANKPRNMVHILINNGAHESVGGMPTVASKIDFPSVARACGYACAVKADSYEKLDEELILAKNRNELSFIEVACAIGSRHDLGRPTTGPLENKKMFMARLKNNI